MPIPSGGRAIQSSDIAGFICDVIASPATGTQSTDTANLQAAIDATPTNGWLHIPRGAYQINAALTITKNMKITGAGAFPVVGNILLPDVPVTSPYLSGTTITQNTAATDAVQITGRNIKVDLSDFGILFAAAIMFQNTGHGINATPTVAGGQTYHNTGLVYSTFRNVAVFGHDGNHYAFNFLNEMLLTLENLRSWGGGVMQFDVDNPLANYGNAVIIHPYGVLMCSGSANGYTLKGGDTGQSMGYLNLMTFIRPQVNVENFESTFTLTKPTASQKLWDSSTTNSARITTIELISPDFENGMAGVTLPINFNTNTYITAGGGYFTNAAAYIESRPYNPSTTPSVAALAGAGTGATATLGARPTDLSGTVILTTGTGSPSGDLATVTFGTTMLQAPKYVAVFVTRAGAAQQFTVSAFSTTSFTIAAPSGSSPAASTQYQISWRVEQ